MKPELRVYLRERCLIHPEAEAAVFGALLGLFVPKLIETAIGGVASWLKKAGQEKTETVSGEELANLYTANDDQVLRVNRKLGCIIGVYGVFEDADGDPTPETDKAVRALEEAGLVAKNADIRIVFEAAIRRTPDETAFYLETRHFSVRNFIGKSGKDERDFVATLNVRAPDATADGITIAIGNVDLGRMERPTFLWPGEQEDGSIPRSNLMPWRQISSESKAAYDADVAAGVARGREYMPVAFDLTIVETADGNAWLTKLGEFLDSAKGKAAEQISKRILPEERAKAEAERTEAAEKLYEAELAAQLEVRKKQKAYDEGEEADKPILRMELEIAKRKLERRIALRKAAGLPDLPPVPGS